MKKNWLILLAVGILILSIFFNIYFLFQQQAVKRSINFIYREANAYISSGDTKSAYEIARTIQNSFRLPREGMVKALEKAIKELRESEGEKKYYNASYYDALLKIGHQYHMSGMKKEALDAYMEYIKAYPNAQDAKMRMESLSKEVQK